jgi:protoheme IX farnesyltransferase
VTALDARPVAVSEGAASRARPLRATVRAYVALTKPRIIELLLVTTVPVMILAAGGRPGIGTVVATLVGGSLAAGSANALNCYLDRDIDQRMRRTERRPLPAAAVSPREALAFGVGLGAVATAVMLVATNVPATALTVVAILFYVFVYTLVLKRRTPQNIVWGGAAGCMPVLIGWAAVTGGVGWAPIVLFLVVFFWTPPHYWPLSMRFREDYRAAGVPMLPVVVAERVVTRQIVAYSWAMVAASLAVWPIASMGPAYAATAIAAGAIFLAEAHRLDLRARRGLHGAALRPMRLFHGSITYLTVLFLAVGIDPLLFG